MRYELPYACPKSSIPMLGSIKGTLNATDFEIDGILHPPHTLRFLGFAGSLKKSSGLYEGMLRLQKITAPTEEGDLLADFNEIIEG